MSTGKGEKFVKTCPKCGSTNVQPNFEIINAADPSMYGYDICHECGFTAFSYMFPEMEKKDSANL